MTLIQSIIALGSIGILAGIILVIAYNKLKVEEDPRVEELIEALPGTNCGACGYASCHEYAVSINKSESETNLCRAGGTELGRVIAEIMGVSHEDSNEIMQKAVIRCQAEERKALAEYTGPETCETSQLLGGGTACKYGCLGYGDCVIVCPFDAIYLDNNSLPVVVLDKCTGCGLCLKACPRNIIALKDLRNKRIVYVGCNNVQTGQETRKLCASGCIACKICEKKGPENAFTVENNLAEVRNQTAKLVISEIKCPTTCIYEKKV
ncbi:MAG: RnfABCDGE type electron transport complex subunit B [bacterium]|nr:RnfABCDGE type electron transport complex subunit B [bacterium]